MNLPASRSLLPLLVLSLTVTACAKQSGTGWDNAPVTTAGPALAAPDTVSLRLAEAAEKASASLDSIARIESGQSAAPSESAPYGGPTGVSTGNAATVQAAAPTALATPTYVAPPPQQSAPQQQMQPQPYSGVSSSMLPPGSSGANAAMVAPATTAGAPVEAGGYTGYGEGDAGAGNGMLVGGAGSVQGVQYAVAPPMNNAPPLAQASAPAELSAPVTIKWYGPIESLLNTLANRAGYAFKTEGAQPPVPLTVNIDVYNKPLVDVIKSASYQVAGKADVELDAGSQTLTLRYAPVMAGSY